jgi:hypothetical protein
VTPDELALLADALSRGRSLSLRDGLYPISAVALGVPAQLGRAAVEALRRDFEHAAVAHREALRRRRQFRLL